VLVVLGLDPPGGKEEQAAAKHKSPTKKSKKKKPASSSPASSSEKNENENKGEGEGEGEGEGSEKEGQGGGAEKLVLSATATRQLVTIKVKAEQQQLARVGERAPVTLPGGRVVSGTVIDVGTVASSPSKEEKGGGGEGEAPTITVTLALRRHVAHLDQAPVSVQLVKSIRRHVLTVPAGALVATAGGSYAVEALQGDRRVAVRVTPGMFADGYVEIEGAGVHEGMTVLEPR
jgi:hypothetical protein